MSQFTDLTTGARLHYETVGDGAPLIALHGLLGTARLHLGAVMDWLSADYRIYGVTLRGYGESMPKPRDFPLDFYRRDALDVLAFMDALELEKAHLIGYSDGGETALMAAGLAPERFPSVAVWGALGKFGEKMRPSIQRMYPATWLLNKPDTMVLHGITDANRFVLQWVRAAQQYIDTGGDVSLQYAAGIDCPVMLMLGKEDHLNPEEYAQEFVDRAPNARLTMFDCAHAIHDEQPDEFKQVLDQFLKNAG